MKTWCLSHSKRFRIGSIFAGLRILMQILDSHQFCCFLYYGHLYSVVLSPQRSHDEAITSRTNLRLKVEEEEMQQELVELKLKRDHARAKLGGCVVM